MRERWITFLLALGALVAFYGIWLRPSPSLDPNADIARPTTGERRGNGYAGLFEWLEKSGVEVRSMRERYTALKDFNVSPRGNVLVLTLPGVEVFRNEEFRALDEWVRKGNTLLIVAALVDQPNWAERRASGAVTEIEQLTGLEFETDEARKARLDETPLAERVRRADEAEAKRESSGEDTEYSSDEYDEDEEAKEYDSSKPIVLSASGPHPLLKGVKTLELDSDYEPDRWLLRIPYDGFLLTLARTEAGDGVLFEQRLGEGAVLLSSGGSMFTNRALGQADNAALFANIIRTRVAPLGAVFFDDLRQGLSASYDPARFYKDPRLYTTLGILLALWLVWVLGSTRLRAPPIVQHDPSEAELVRRAGGLISRTVKPHLTAMRLFDQFFAGVERVSRGAGGVRNVERGELWQWLERNAAILPQEMDQLKNWYADAYGERKLALAPLQNLLDSIGKRLQT